MVISLIVMKNVYKLTKTVTTKMLQLSVVKSVDVKNVINMAKMRLFKFWNADGVEKEKEETSLKKATRAVQGDFKDKMISVEYISKKGKEMCHSIVIPIGRKLRQSILQEQRRLAQKAKNASR